MIIAQEEIFMAFMIFIRAGAIIALIPMFGGRVVPMQFQVALAGGIALILFPIISSGMAPPEHAIGLFIAFFRELFVGVLLGFAVRMVFFIGEFAGTLISTEMSLMRSDSFDPLLQSNSTIISSLFFYLTAILILLSGTHYLILEAFVLSYQKVPIQASLPSFHGVEAFARATGDIFLLGLKIAAPIVALGFIINVMFAVLGKAVPKMNVFIVSFSVRILAGLSLFLLTIGLVIHYFYNYIVGIPSRMIQFLSF